MPSSSSGSDSDQGKGVFIGVTVTFIIASIIFFARLISRFGITKHKGWDDFFIIAAWLLALGLSASVDFAASKGLGRDKDDIPESFVRPLLASKYAFTILYNPALMATRTSILMFYLYISKSTERFLRVSSYITLAAVNIGGLIVTFLSAFRCDPVEGAYNPSIADPTCISVSSIFVASAPLNVASDLAILVLPLPVLTKMYLPWRQKAIIVLLFSLYTFVTVVDVVRIYYLQLAEQSNPGGNFSLDHSGARTALLWSTIEVNVAISCACIPATKPIIQLLLPGIIFDNISFGSNSTNTASESQRNTSDTKDKPRGTDLAVDYPDKPRGTDLAVDYPLTSVNVQSTTGQEDDITVSPSSALPTQIKTQTELQTMHGEADEPSLVLLTGFPISSRPGNMLNMRGWQCCKHCIVVTTVVFVWGFTYGILTSLNSRTPNMANGSLAQVVSIVSVFFGGFLFGAFIGQWVLRFSGFKATLITGLAIFCLGTLMYWPSGALNSYPAFIVSNFVVGIGLSVIELAAFLFLLLCGAPQYADTRLLIALGIQTVASLLSGLLSRRVFLVNVVSTQWVYLGCALAVTLLALFLYYARLPEASDAELQSQTDALKHLYNQSCFDKPRIFRLNRVLFFLAIFTSEGGVQSLDIFFAYLLPSVAEATNTAQSISTNDYYIVGTGMFAFSRFLCALLCLFIPPRILLLVSFIGATVFSALTMGLHTGNVNSTATYGLMTAFFEGPLFPLIFSMGVRGLGSWTKVGGALLVAAECGASVFPFVMLGVIQSAGRSVQYSFCVALATFAAGTAFAVYINIFRPLHDQLDPVAMPVAVQRRPTIDGVEIDEPVATGVFQAKQHS